jgi:TRAP-type C4-dicarboxylate transport system permease small subunit
MERSIRAIDRIAGLFLAAVAALTFLEAVLRYFAALQIPDWYALACLFQGVAIFWGMASTTYEGKHIVVDALWEMCGAGVRRAIDLVAELVTAAFFAVFAWMLVHKVLSTWREGEVSTQIGFALWPFHLVAGLGIVCAALLAGLRLWRALARRG